MLDNLPNELIGEILSPVLDIPNDMFREVSEPSPFSRPSHISASSIVGVCKTWMNVATPLLYRVVVLRSKPQAYALMNTLHKHKELGDHIKKLRVEGAYGPAMRVILHAAQNITDLCLSLDTRFSDEVNGLCSSLTSINPCCVVILAPTELRIDGPLPELVATLKVCLESWTNLAEVYVSLSAIWSTAVYTPVIEGLINAPNLRTITSSAVFDELSLRKLAENKSLKAIHLKSKHAVTNTLIKSLFRDPVVKKLVVIDPVFSSLPVFKPVLPSNPAFVPMTGVSKAVRDAIWGRILRFAFEIDSYCDGVLNNGRIRMLSRLYQTRTSITQVCRDFRHLSKPYNFGFPIFMQPKDVVRFAAAVTRDPSLGTHLRSLHFRGVILSSSSLRLRRIFSHSPNLQHLRAIKSVSDTDVGDEGWTFNRLFITWDTFERIAHIAGRSICTLQDISVVRTEEPVCPSVFGRFLALRHLHCGMSPHFNVDVNVMQRHSLSNLQSIQLWTCHPSFLDVLTFMDLPALQEFDLVQLPPDEEYTMSQSHLEAFLQKHGPKIQAFRIGNLDLPIFELCPNVKHVKMTMPNSIGRAFRGDATHSSLLKIMFDDRGTRSCRSTHDHETMVFLSSIHLSRFSNLREIQLPGLRWPTTEYDILKSYWPKCSAMLAKLNVKLTDNDGCHWRPRLQW